MKIRNVVDRILLALFLMTVLAIVFVLIMVQPYLEARAFNRATGKNVSAFDALFVDLRVQAGAE